MSIRRLGICLSLVFLAVVLIGIAFRSPLSSQSAGQNPTVLAGRNVNMVSGTTLPGGDPWLQRQNEPTIAVSSRNPLHLLAGANDYRTVDMPTSEGDLPGKGPGAMVGDAWLGVFMSYDGGESWTSTMLPGFPQDTDPRFNPLKGFQAAADPVVRSGPNGIFYYSGIAFNRSTPSIGVIFVARFIDNNNTEGGNSIQYLDTTIIATGTATTFLDKPWIAVDQPRLPAGNITVAGQSIPRHNVYIAYSAFRGSGSSTVGDIMFARSTDCGTTWGAPIKISTGSYAHQGATIVIKPVLGEVLVGFRRFAQASSRTPDSIFVAQSFTRGLNFGTPVKVADIVPFDQPTTTSIPAQLLPGTGPGPALRTNSYPTMAVDASGHVYVAWSQRNVGPFGAARIMISTSYLGLSWGMPQPVANGSFLGHQIMPSFSFAGGKLMLVWYDQRNEAYGQQNGFGNWIIDDGSYRHTMDVWAAMADTSKFPTLTWKSTQVSRYLYAALKNADGSLAYDTNGYPRFFPVQFNCVNYPLFKGGTSPFDGDYIDVAASPTFRIDTWRNWYINATSTDSPVFQVAWTDNRDVRPPLDGLWSSWTKYTPPSSSQDPYLFITPGRPECSPTGDRNAPGMRNQNIYSARVTWGIEAGSPTNTKPLNLSDAARAFVVFVKNNTGSLRYFLLKIAGQPVGGQASFLQFGLLTSLNVDIAAYSTTSRPVFVSSTDPTAPVTINISETDATGSVLTGGLKSSVLLNGDPTSPQLKGGDETHDPTIVNPANPIIVDWYVSPGVVTPNLVNLNPNLVNPDIVDPNLVNPNLVNPNLVNPNLVNPNLVNPNLVNYTISNPNLVNPNLVNPNLVNPNLVNVDPADVSITDVQWTVENTGNATTSYTLKTLSKKEPPDGVYVQLLVYRVHLTPAVAGAELSSADSRFSPCTLQQEAHHELVLNLVNPNLVNPNLVNPNLVNPNLVNSSIENATLSVAPGEQIIVDLRVLDSGLPQTGGTATVGAMAAPSEAPPQVAANTQDFISSLGFAVTSQAVNTVDARTGGSQTPPAAATTLVIGTASLPDGFATPPPGTPYSATLKAYGGSGNYIWTFESGELPPGLGLSSEGLIGGTPTTPGIYNFIVRVDSGDQFDTQRYSIYVYSGNQPGSPAILTNSLPSGILGYYYGATLEATGGVWPRTWRLASGSLPLGLILDSGGVISGTIQQETSQDYPTTYNFSVVVTDKNGVSSAPQPLGIYVNLWTKTYIKISGKVYSTDGTPLNGAVMRGLPNTPVSGTNGTPGYYEDTVPYLWSGTVIPFKARQTFSPSSRTYTQVASDQNYQDYNFQIAPVPSVIQVETAPDGSGTVVPAQNVSSGSSITVYAITRGSGGNFIANVAADSWSLASKTGGVVDGDLVVPGDGTSAVFTGHLIGSAQIHAAKSPLTSIDSGVLSVTGGAAGMIAVTGPSSVDAGFMSQAFTLTSQDGSGNPSNVAQNTVFNLASNTMGIGTFYSDPVGKTPIAQVTILLGQSSTQFYYLDTMGGTRTVTATWASGGNNLGISTRHFYVRSGAGRIAFTSDRDGNSEIYVMNADGSGQARLTYNSAADRFLSLSPDGSRIAFTSDRDGNSEIYVMNADGSGQARLTYNSAADSNPSWSPDGSRIAFDSGREGGAKIYVMNADGSGVTRLTNNGFPDFKPSWSPDGSKIVFTSARNNFQFQIYVMNADGTGQTRLTNSTGQDDGASWSPDGSKIVFMGNRTGNLQIYVMNADGSGQTCLTNNTAQDGYPSWSPDGSKIAFVSNRNGNDQIYVMNADGTGQTRLTISTGQDDYPSWGGSNLEFIAFSSDRSGNYEIYVMNADGSGTTNLTNNPGWDATPSWGLSGTKIVFVGDRDGNNEIYVMNADGTGQMNLSNNSAGEYEPSFSPDGSKIAFVSNRNSNDQIYVMNADGSGQTRLTSNSARDNWPKWSPDGSRIAFSSNRDGNREIYIMNADGSSQTRLTNTNPASNEYPCFSPNGSKIAFSSDRDGNYEIYLMNPDGSGQTRLTNNTVTDLGPSWSPDGNRIVYSSSPDNGSLEIYVMNADGSGQTRLTNNTSYDVAPSWRPHPKIPEVYEFVTKWGSPGSGDGQFGSPYPPRAVAVDTAGYIYVGDPGNSRIQKFDSIGNFVTKWGSSGNGDGQFTAGPAGIAVDSAGYVYVVDSSGYRIEKFDSDGNFVTKWGSSGNGDGQFLGPDGIAVDSSRNVYVVDHGNSRIQKFDSSGVFLTKWGSAGDGNGQFRAPDGVAVDSSGYVYVLDYIDSRIQKFDSIGNFVAKWGSVGTGDGQLNYPEGIVIDSSGYFYVTDTFSNRIQKFDSNGNFVTKWGSQGTGDGQFSLPEGIAVDSSGYVYVGDDNFRIQKFRKK